MESCGYYCSLVVVLIAVVLLCRLIDCVVRLAKLSGPHDQRYILITGCDSGFGFETAKRLDSLGCRVFAACLSESGEVELKKCCSDRLKTLRLDVTDEPSIREAFDYVRSSIPSGTGLWGLVNNAGVGAPAVGPLEWLTLDDFRTCLEVNFLGMVAVTTAFLPLVKQERGRIINMSSVLGRTATFFTSAPYITSKHCVESYSDILRRTMHWYGVSVHIIEPSAHPTRMFLDNDEAILRAWRQAPDSIRNQFGPNYVTSLINYYSQNTWTPNKVSGVVDVYEHALLARWPRARYLVGRGCRKLLFIESLPEWLADAILHRTLQFPMPSLR